MDLDEQIPNSLEPGSSRIEGQQLSGFRQFYFGTGGISHCVYFAGSRRDPALLLMPEIAGLSPGLILFAERLIEARFQVYVPWLFGPFSKRAPVRNALRLCISREFANLRAGISAPVASWLRALAGHISRHNEDRNIGAIGMCLTGAFVIPLILDPKVTTAVAAQPAAPCSLLFALLGIRAPQTMDALNVSDVDIAQARLRLSSGAARLRAVRCRADRICPAEKLERLRKEFPVGLETQEYGEISTRNSLGDRPHATFTKEHRLVPDAPPDHHSQQAFDDLIAFFNRHLRAVQF